jgi:hypothetical protein
VLYLKNKISKLSSTVFYILIAISFSSHEDEVESDTDTMVREKVTARDIANVVSRVTGIPIHVSLLLNFE